MDIIDLAEIYPISMVTPGWKNFDEGLLPQDTLEEMLIRYFKIQKSDFENLMRRDFRGGSIELQTSDSTKGYFISYTDIARSYDPEEYIGVFLSAKDYFEGNGRITFKPFIDTNNQVAGFSWRKD